MSQKKKVYAIIVLGDKLKFDGSMTGDFKERCSIAICTLRPGWDNYIVVSGGVTRYGFPAEAQAALDYLAKVRACMDVSCVLIPEYQARTTPENIVLTQQKLRELSVYPDEVAVIGRAGQIPKVSVIVPRVWDYGRPVFSLVLGQDSTPWYIKFVDRTFFVVLSMVDPRGTSFVYAFIKWLSRNG